MKFFEDLRAVGERFGWIWPAFAVFLVLTAAFGKMNRGILATLFVVLATQVWWGPLYITTRIIRWWVIVIMVVRGAFALLGSSDAIDSRAPPFSVSRRLVAGLAVMSVLSAIWSDVPTTSLALSASFALGMFLVFVVFWRVQDMIDLPALFPRAGLLFGFTICALSAAVTIIAMSVGSRFFVVMTGWGGRYQGIFLNPNMLGLLCALLLPIVLAAPRSLLGMKAWLRWPTVALLLAAVFFSGSRSALIGSVIAIGLVAWYRNGAIAFFSLAAIGILGAGVISYTGVDQLDTSAVGHIARTKHIGTLSGRLELWEMGWDAAKDSPLFGVGWGGSRFLFGGTDLEGIVERGQFIGASNLHSAHVQLFVDLGLIGLGMFWTVCGLFVIHGFRILRAPKSDRNQILMLLFCSGLGMLADSFVHGGIFSIGSPMALLFWIFFAIILKEGEKIEYQESMTPHRSFGRALRPEERLPVRPSGPLPGLTPGVLRARGGSDPASPGDVRLAGGPVGGPSAGDGPPGPAGAFPT